MIKMIKEVLIGVAIVVVSSIVLDRSRGGVISQVRARIPAPSKLTHRDHKMHSV